MKFLFVATGSPATFYAVAPLATAVRNAGHEVLLAAHEPWMTTVEAIGVPSVCFSREPVRHYMKPAAPGKLRIFPNNLREEMMDAGRGFARMTAAVLPALTGIARDWRPDVIVGSSVSYAAGLAAARLAIPYVRQAEYLAIPMADIDPGAEEGLQPELRPLGLARLPDPALFIDVTPPSLMPPYDPNAAPMRWIPSNAQHCLQPWMYTRPPGRRRVLVTAEFRAARWSMASLAAQLTAAGAEVIIEDPAAAPGDYGAGPGGARSGWIPLDVLAPTCDLAVHHAGASTAMTFMAAGVPQLIIPPNNHTQAIAQSLADFRAGIMVMILNEDTPGQDLADVIAAGCAKIFSTPRYARNAQALAAEIAALPAPSELVRTLEALAGDHAGGHRRPVLVSAS